MGMDKNGDATNDGRTIRWSCTFADANESATLTFSAANWRMGSKAQLGVKIFDLRAMWNAKEEAL